MELDELKAAWQILDRQLEAQSALDLHVFKEGRLEKARLGLRPLYWGQVLQILFGLALVLFAAPFWMQHRDLPHLLIAGVSIHVYGVLAIIFAGITLGMTGRIDYAAPVLGIQKQLARLRRLYILNGICVGLPWWLLWVPLLMMLLMSTAGADLYANAPWFVDINLAAGIAGMLATWSFQRWSRDPRRSRLAKFVDDRMTGASLRRAQGMLDEIARFEHA